MLESISPEELTYRVPKDQWLYLLFAGNLFTVSEKMKGGTIAVIGSASPWVEALALVIGAQDVVTLEYNNLTYDHPKISTIAGRQLDEFYHCKSSNQQRFDLVISMSSVDHDGLGRYGDPLRADGDLLAMKRMGQILKPGGFLILSVPVGPDVIVFNLHRRYGERRLAALLEDWRVAGRLGWREEMLVRQANWRQSYEPIFVLQKREDREFSCLESIDTIEERGRGSEL
jgi:SAM-dependent methyltransferase